MKFDLKAVLVLASISTIALGALVMHNQLNATQSAPPKTLIVGLPGTWRSLTPGLQHTVFADIVLSNKFEPLIGANASDVHVALGAKSWHVSEDFKTIRFQVDTSRTYPDGTRLSAADYKSSWEEGARLRPLSANGSLQDLLYKVEGYDQFKTTGTLSGLRVIDDATLEVRFSTPFRMAIEHLQGNRFAAFKKEGTRLLGTGFFEFEEISPNHVRMIPRQSEQKDQPILEVKSIASSEIVQHLLDGRIDAIHHMPGHNPATEQLIDPEFEILPGPVSVHLALGLNSTNQSIFFERKYRLALQALVQKTFLQHRSRLPDDRFIQLDPQFYMPLQAGRLEIQEVQKLIASGEQYIPALLKIVEQKPLVVVGSLNGAKLFEVLKQSGLTLSKDSRLISAKEFIELSYSKTGPDIMIEAYSVANGDPDGLYHALGENGAIRTPYVFSQRVSDLLERGREVTSLEALDPFYKDVSRALLTEVPSVHIGFARVVTAFNKTKVWADTSSLRRNQGQMHFLKAK